MSDSGLLDAEWWLRQLHRLEVISTALVVLGVAGEFASSWLSARPQKVVDDARVVAMQTLARDTAAANERAESARLELARFKAPRRLTEMQMVALISEMTNFRGIPFDFLIQPSAETLALVRQLGDCLTKAGLQWIPWTPVAGKAASVFNEPGLPQFGIVAFSGTSVQIAEARRSMWASAVQTLVQQLNSMDIKTSGQALTDGSENDVAIHIYIGEKPIN